MTLSHLVHHRGQFSVHLRLLDARGARLGTDRPRTISISGHDFPSGTRRAAARPRRRTGRRPGRSHLLPRVGPVDGGPRGLIAALQASVAPGGTLVMPSFSDDDDNPFDRARTTCAGMGVVANTFAWTLPGVLRSDSPHAFAAAGPRARGDHRRSSGGFSARAGIVRSAASTSSMAGCCCSASAATPTRRFISPRASPASATACSKYVIVSAGAGTARVDYGEIDHCCENFNKLDEWLDAEHRQRRGHHRARRRTVDPIAGHRRRGRAPPARERDRLSPSGRRRCRMRRGARQPLAVCVH